jgi:DNA-binding CsgD family transcriptional regulator
VTTLETAWEKQHNQAVNTTASEVVGRREERAAVERLLARRSGMLVLEGEAGIGKTTVWRAGVELARERSYRVLTASTAAAEGQLAHAALRDLLHDLFEDVEGALPAPQTRALAVALLLEEPGDAPPGQAAVAAGFLGALRVAASEAPVLVAVDDIQWLDGSSALALGFAARRVRDDDAIAFLFSRRTGQDAPALELERLPAEKLSRLAIGPLSLGALQALLMSRLGLSLSRPALRAVHEMSGGNPFYALEIARALPDPSWTPAPGELPPVPVTLRGLVDTRVADLPAATRDALAVAASLRQPTLGLVDAVISQDAAGVIAPAVAEGVVDVDGDSLRFAHPLLAAAAYERLPQARRREVHASLARLLDEEEERARHLALAATEPGEQVASTLERAAANAARRGATAAAADLAAEAQRLTPASEAAAWRRRIRAEADYAVRAGDPRRATGALERLLASRLPDAERGVVLAQLARVGLHGLDWASSIRRCHEALRHAADPGLRAAIEIDLMRALSFVEEDDEALRHLREAARLAAAAGDEPLLVSALLGVETRERGEPSPRTIQRFLALELPPAHFTASSAYPYVLGLADRFAEALAYYELMREYARDHGEEAPYSWTLVRMAQLECLRGEWQQALSRAEEAAEVAGVAGHAANEALALATSALLEAKLGRVEGARASAGRALGLAEPAGAAQAMTLAQHALGFVDLSLSDAAAAHARLGPVIAKRRRAGVMDPSVVRFVPDEVEALVQIGDEEGSTELLGWYEQLARAAGRPLSLAATARCRGILAGARGDVHAALEALREHERVEAPFERARTLLAQGSALRRAKRKRVARQALGEALAEFERLGAALWAEHARSELARISGRAPAGDGLTPTEERVVELVAEGLRNREIAARLFLSEKTVEFHLRNVFRKLGVRSRSELARAFKA